MQEIEFKTVLLGDSSNEFSVNLKMLERVVS